jgi:hypothetical protein
MALSYSNAARSAQQDATGLNAFIGTSALLRIYSGTRPANANTALSGNTLLAELTCNASAFGSVTNGVLTAGAVTSDSSANATGTASFFRLVKSDGTTVVMDGDIGTSGADLNLNTVSIVSTGTVAVSSFVITRANA